MAAASLLAIGSAIVFYIVFVYPILLACSGRRGARAVRKDMQFRPTVSTVLAVYNGEEFLRAKLASLLALEYPAELVDILVVSDGSTDGTDAIAAGFEGRGVRLLRIPHGGKAAALNAGLQSASGAIVFFTDVRQPLDPRALSHLVANFADPAVGVVTGKLRYFNTGQAGEQALMKLYWRYELWARLQHSRIDSMYGATGCIYAVRRELAGPMPPDTLTDDAVLPLRAYLRGYRVIFDPEAIAFDYPAAEGGEFRRRLRTLAGTWQVYLRMPEMFTRPGRMRFHFLSHKFARLVLPWAIVMAVVGTWGLAPSLLRTCLLAGEWLLAVLALADTLVSGKSPLKRITSPARTFLMMNAAALLSVLVFFVPAGKLWGTTRVNTDG